jgi:hypothetical protein
MALTKSKSGIVYDKKASNKFDKKVDAAAEKYSKDYTAKEVAFIIWNKFGYFTDPISETEVKVWALDKVYTCKS